MALNKTKIDVVLNKGIDNKKDSKTTLTADLLALENRVFTKSGVLNKRNGFNVLSNQDCNDAVITNMEALSLFNNKELTLFANSKLYSYSTPIDRWVQKDSVLSASIKLQDVVNNSDGHSDYDFCSANGVSLIVWKNDTTGYLEYSVQDDASGSFFIQNAELTQTGDSPRCIALGNSLFVFYGDSTALKFLSISAASPCAAAATGTITTTYENLHTDHIFDITSIGFNGFIFYKGATANTVQELEINTGGLVINDNTVTATVIDCLTVGTYTASDAKDYLHLAYKQTTSLVKAAIYTRTMVVQSAIQTIDATSSTDIQRITLGKQDSTDSVRIFYQTNGSSPEDTLIRSNTLSLAGTAGTASVFLRSVGIASKAFNTGSILLLNVLHESPLQATVFTVNEDKEVVTVLSRGNAGTHAAMWTPPSVYQLTTGEYAFPVSIKGRIRSENSTLFSLLGISVSKLDFTGPNVYNSTTLNNNLFAVGGLLNNYDGQQVTEQGFHLFPEGVAQSGTATSGGFISDGVYQYSAVYRWVDNKGNVHQSAPSVPITYTAAGGTSLQTISINVPTLRITQKTGVRGEATVELYRTEAAGTIFYKVTSVSSPTNNNTTTDTVTIVDTLADASIISNEILYTTGGILDNIAAPACDITVSHKNRLFIAGLQNKNEIRYSKITRVGEGVAFNEALSIIVDPVGGDITALASMDSNLLILKRDNVYRVAGDGPSDTGSGGSFTEPELISTDVGCVDTNSVVLGSVGLFFKSSKGIYLIDRSLTSVYIGSQVEDFNGESITSAKILDDVNEVRFATSSGNILVYNYFFKQWSVFTGNNMIDTEIFNNAYTGISLEGNFLQENTGFKDNDAFVNSKISTGWIKVSGLQGYQRAYRLAVLGEFKSKHQLKVTIYNDYSSIVMQEHVFDVNSILSADTGFYGDDTYGTTDPYGQEDNGVYQFTLHLKRQKCQALRVVIEDVYDNSDNDGTGEGANITGLTVEVGTKRGINKQSQTKKA